MAAATFPPTSSTETVVVLNRTIVDGIFLTPSKLSASSEILLNLPSLLTMICVFMLLGMGFILLLSLHKLMKQRLEEKIRCARLISVVGKIREVQATELEEVMVVPTSLISELEMRAAEMGRGYRRGGVDAA